MPIINRYTRKVVRIGDKYLFPGNMPVEVTAFGPGEVVFKGQDGFTVSIPTGMFGLETTAQVEPSTLMTDDDWIHATNNAKETGGHFMGHLARAYQHADGSNRPPIKKAYHTHFFRFLSQERMEQLKMDAES